jgi:hypothetical protein
LDDEIDLKVCHEPHERAEEVAVERGVKELLIL